MFFTFVHKFISCSSIPKGPSNFMSDINYDSNWMDCTVHNLNGETSPILDYNLYGNDYEKMNTDHSFLSEGATGNSYDGLLPHISPFLMHKDPSDNNENFKKLEAEQLSDAEASNLIISGSSEHDNFLLKETIDNHCPIDIDNTDEILGKELINEILPYIDPYLQILENEGTINNETQTICTDNYNLREANSPNTAGSKPNLIKILPKSTNQGKMAQNSISIKPKPIPRILKKLSSRKYKNTKSLTDQYFYDKSGSSMDANQFTDLKDEIKSSVKNYIICKASTSNSSNSDILDSLSENVSEILLNSKIETEKIWNYIETCNKSFDIRSLYNKLSKQSFIQKHVEAKDMCSLFIYNYYDYVLKLVSKYINCGIRNKLMALNFATIDFDNLEKAGLLINLDSLKSQIYVNGWKLNFLQKSQWKHLDPRIIDNIQNMIRIDEEIDFRSSKLLEEQDYIDKTVNFNFKSKFPFSPKNIRELELFVLKHLYKLPRGIDSLMICQSFIHNITLRDGPLKHRQLLYLLYIIRRFFILTDVTTKNMGKKDYIEFMIMILRSGNIFKKTSEFRTKKILFEIIFDIRFKMQKGEDESEKLLILLGSLFPYNTISSCLHLSTIFLESIVNGAKSTELLRHIYKSTIFDIFILLKHNKIFYND